MTTSVSHSSAKYRRRNLVESLMAGAIPYLELCAGVSEVKFCSRSGVSTGSLAAWEKEFHPCKLPRAYKDFLLVTNGLDVIWSVKLKGRVVPVGSMHIASIDSIVRLKLSSTGKAQDFRAAFVIDENKLIGTVAMVYREADEPEFWFQTAGGEWHFICPSFSNYYRLMIAHLGIYGWHFAFTDVGLPRHTAAWLAFYAPERADAYAAHRSETTLRDNPRAAKALCSKTAANGSSPSGTLDLKVVNQILAAASKSNGPSEPPSPQTLRRL